MSDEKIIDLGKLPHIKVPDSGKIDEVDSLIASMKINVAMNGGYALEIHFEDNRYPITMIFQNKPELMVVLNTILLR